MHFTRSHSLNGEICTRVPFMAQELLMMYMRMLIKVADDLAIPLLSVEEENKLKKAMEKESRKKAAVRR